MKIKEDGIFFSYLATLKEASKYNLLVIETGNLRCCICDYTLDTPYSFIIRKLQMAEILSKDFRPLCCVCHKIKVVAEKRGKSLQFYKPDELEVVGKRWKHYFPHLNIVCEESEFSMSTSIPHRFSGAVFLSHQRSINLCDHCSREDCPFDWGTRGRCDGYAPKSEFEPFNPILDRAHTSVMERVEEFNRAMDEQD